MAIEPSLALIRCADDPNAIIDVRFVTPATAALLAARSMHQDIASQVTFASACHDYAANNGLIDTLAGKYVFPIRGGRQGATYTKLTRLASHVEVDACNAVVNDLIEVQVDPVSPVLGQMLRKSVGELHDNVASHANGSGYSCAQVYSEGGARRVEFAIADAGCGMLHNVRRAVPAVDTHVAAIQWCLQRGNTSSRPPSSGWEQRLPDDAIFSPFPPSVGTVSVDDHHVGEGLWRLSELVAFSTGTLEILSGDAVVCRKARVDSTASAGTYWTGVAVVVEFTFAAGQTLSHSQSAALEQLAERLGL